MDKNTMLHFIKIVFYLIHLLKGDLKVHIDINKYTCMHDDMKMRIGNPYIGVLEKKRI